MDDTNKFFFLQQLAEQLEQSSIPSSASLLINAIEGMPITIEARYGMCITWLTQNELTNKLELVKTISIT